LNIVRRTVASIDFKPVPLILRSGDFLQTRFSANPKNFRLSLERVALLKAKAANEAVINILSKKANRILDQLA